MRRGLTSAVVAFDDLDLLAGAADERLEHRVLVCAEPVHAAVQLFRQVLVVAGVTGQSHHQVIKVAARRGGNVLKKFLQRV